LELAEAEAVAITVAQSAASALVADNVLANCLPLFEALALERSNPQAVVLQLSARTLLRVGLSAGTE
jgi:hypothetical protein